ncbi:hypothetical protein [Prochlorococcus marinus]|uniref:hypothetical protein n=1 Tax=Prochlorococcus marinus TaxID=1219 RepID=UPI0022B4F9E4|nr:hypothetical protein [Prochlorococcus marinus]
MIASCLKPSLNSSIGVVRIRNDKRLPSQKKNQNLIKPLIAAICFLFCIVVVPEKPMNLASICEKYNSSDACQVW